MWENFTEYVTRLWSSTFVNRLEWAIAVAVVFEVLIWFSSRRLRAALQPLLQRDLYLEATERVQRRRVLLMLPLRLLRGGLTALGLLVILRYLGFATSAELIPILLGLLAFAALAGWRVWQDMVAGYFLMCDDLFATGDRVSIGEHTGLVMGVGLRFTRLQGPDGREIAVANREIRAVVNHTRNRDLQKKAQSV